LRSGNYTQGRSRLAGFDLSQKQWQYCCLGVACELYQEHVGGLPVQILDGEKQYDRQNSHLPEKVRKWLGFKETAAALLKRSPRRTAVIAEPTGFVEVNATRRQIRCNDRTRPTATWWTPTTTATSRSRRSPTSSKRGRYAIAQDRPSAPLTELIEEGQIPAKRVGTGRGRSACARPPWMRISTSLTTVLLASRLRLS
jgi:hypothetical protein